MAMIEIADEIWPLAEERAELDGEWPIDLHLTTDADPRAAERALITAIVAWTRLLEAEEEKAPSGLYGELCPGEWYTARTRSGVAFHVTECDDFARGLPLVAGLVAEAGVGGRIDLFEPAERTVGYFTGPLLVAHLRVRGERVTRPDSATFYSWRPDDARFAATVGAAERWLRGGAALPETAVLSVSIAPDLELAPGETAVDRMVAEDVDQLRSARLTRGADPAFGLVETSFTGRVEVVIGGEEALTGDGWRAALDALASLIRTVAGDLVAASVRRVPNVHDIRADRFGSRPRGTGMSGEAFDDLFAADAFGVQMLGAGVANRVGAPAGPWHAEALGDGAVLLAHDDPAAWFAAGDGPAPELLAAARADLAGLIYAPGALEAHGFPGLL